jgi:hypothetical protein
LGDTRVDERRIFKADLKKKYEDMWSGWFQWWAPVKTAIKSGLHKMKVYPWLGNLLLASQVEFCSIVLVNWYFCVLVLTAGSGCMRKFISLLVNTVVEVALFYTYCSTPENKVCIGGFRAKQFPVKTTYKQI